jgi:hypothetical protein
LTEFVATKRVGSVLRSERSLTWHQASQVLELLLGDIGAEVDVALLAAVRELFDPSAQLAPEAEGPKDVSGDHPERGPVYHSRRVLFTLEGFGIVLGVSFTICVRMGVPLLAGPVRPSQSKFWCSAIIHGDRPDDVTVNDKQLGQICAKIDKGAMQIRDDMRPLYERAVRSIHPTIGDILPTGDDFSMLVFQIMDENFRRDLGRLERGDKLSEMPSDSALGLLNHFFSGDSADTYLHVGRKDLSKAGDADIKVDTLLQTSEARAQALVIETKAKKGKKRDCADWRRLGATSETEPVERKGKRADDLVDRLIHSPANAISAQMAAEMGRLF